MLKIDSKRLNNYLFFIQRNQKFYERMQQGAKNKELMEEFNLAYSTVRCLKTKLKKHVLGSHSNG